MAYDILIKNGILLDGTGKEPVKGDIGISGEKIALVGGSSSAKGERTVDVEGSYVAPGFIDVTNHSDTYLTLLRYPMQESMVMQGITTIIGGNCGASLAPLGSHEALGAIKKWADPSEINVNWGTVGEYLSEIEKLKLGINYGTFAGYGTIRRGIIGDEIRAMSPDERARAKYLLESARADGAFGLSLGLAFGHERVSSSEEIIAIAFAMEKRGGIVKLHLRSEGGGLLSALNEAIQIGRETGLPIHINHLKAIGTKSWRLFGRALKLIENAKSSGLAITFDVSPYATTGSLLYSLIPAWARQGGFKELFERLKNPSDRMKIIEELKTYTLHYDRILIVSAKVTEIVGRTIADIAVDTGLAPEEALVEIVQANDGRVSIIGKTVSAKNTHRAMIDPNGFVATDGAGYAQEYSASKELVHPRSFGAFAHFWHHIVADEKKMPPENAIRKITSGPADAFGLTGRGYLKKGAFADVVVFHPKLFKDRATYREPFRYPAGVEWVFINGRLIVEQGRHTGERVGAILRKK